MTTKDRLKEFIEYKKISDRGFCKAIEVSNGFLSTGKHIGTDKAEKIISTYPELDLYWLVTGKGDMIRNSDKKETTNDETEKLKRKIFELEIRLDECRRKNDDDNFQKAIS